MKNLLFSFSDFYQRKHESYLTINRSRSKKANPIVIFAIVISAISLSSCSIEQAPGVSPYSPEKELISFSFKKINNPGLDKDYVATIQDKKVNIMLPKGFDQKKLIPSFTVSDKATFKIGNLIIKSDTTVTDFSGISNITILAQNETKEQYSFTIELVGITSNLAINNNTSYKNFINNNLYIDFSIAIPVTAANKAYDSYSYFAKAFGDFDKDGDLDIVASFNNTTNTTSYPVELYLNNGFQFIKSVNAFTGTTPKLIAGSKAITGDFDNNGWLDVVIASTGFNGGSYPGETILILLNSNGKFTSKDLNIGAGYYGSVCSGDVDNDGDLDLFVTDNKTISKFLINDGTANFKFDNQLYPNSLYNKSYFTSELFDINKDGYLDLVVGGFEHHNAATTIFWGNSSGSYMESSSKALPKVVGKGNVLDIDFIDYNKDNKTDILLTRRSDGTTPDGFYMQIIKNVDNKTFEDLTSTIINNNSNSNDNNWIKWVRIQDIDNDGDEDITTVDRFYSKVWVNNSGTFFLQ